jgi:hypothetical protein
MFHFAKSDCPILLLLESGPCLSPDFYLLTLDLVLLHYNLLQTFLHVFVHSIIGKSFTPQTFLVLITP